MPAAAPATHPPSAEHFGHIRAFVATAQAGSFTAAAEQLGLSRSAVGKAVARLEQGLGARLLQRTTRSLALTDEGRDYLQRCTRALDELAAAEAALAARRGLPTGLVRIGLPRLFGRQWVLPELLALQQRHPGLRLQLVFSSRRADLLDEGLDLAVRIGALPDHAELVARPLGLQQTVLCAAPAFLAAQAAQAAQTPHSGHGTPATPADLAGWPGIASGPGPLRWTLRDGSGRTQAVALASRLQLNDTGAVHDAALAGAGLALLPRWLVAQALRSGALVAVLPGWAGPALPIHLLWPHGGSLPLRVRAVVDALAAAFQPAAPWDAEAA